MAARREQTVVGAIDFGTCNTRMAFGVKGAEKVNLVVVDDWNCAPQMGSTPLSPTSILLDSERALVAYGWEAEEKVRNYSGKETDESYFFKNFKMELHRRKAFDENELITAINGKTLPAIDVFSKALKFLSDKLITFIRRTLEGGADVLKQNGILWVITVPAIWDPRARQFMRKAAYKAQICDPSTCDRLVIALEPECAALYIKHQMHSHHNPALLATHYAVVDCGGGTIDIAYHSVEKQEEDALIIRELAPPSGGPFGGTLVDRAFEQLLDQIFGASFTKKLKERHPNVWLMMITDLDLVKTSLANRDDDDKVRIDLKMSFDAACEDILGRSALEVLRMCTVPGVELQRSKLTINAGMMKKWYLMCTSKTCEILNQDLSQPAQSAVSAIYMVGSFSSSKYLLEEVRKGVKGIQPKHIIRPDKSNTAIVYGAVLYGINPSIIQVRVAGMSYGVGCSRDYDPRKHPESKRLMVDGKLICTGLYREFVAAGESIKTNDVREHTLRPGRGDMKSTKVDIYTALHKVLFLDDPACNKLGTIQVDMPDISKGRDRRIRISMKFGGPEIHVVAIDETTGKAFDTSVSFLNCC